LHSACFLIEKNAVKITNMIYRINIIFVVLEKDVINYKDVKIIKNSSKNDNFLFTDEE
jgi:hypothetical protein